MTLKTTKEQRDALLTAINNNADVFVYHNVVRDLCHDADMARELEWEVQRLDAGGKKAIDVSNSYLAQVCEKEKEIADLRAKLDGLKLEATDYMHAVESLFAMQPEGDCLAERKPSKDVEAYRAFIYLNDQSNLLRNAIRALKEQEKP